MGLREQAEIGGQEADAEHPMLTDSQGRAVRDIAEGERGTFVVAGPNAEPLPDVNESPIEASGDVPVHIAWQRVMGDVWWLGKDRQARDYKYRGIDDVMNHVGPAVRKHGVAVIPIGVSPTYEIIPTGNNKPMNYCRTVSRFRVYGPRGDYFDAETPGEAFDNGDKAGTKAQSVALRTFYIQALALMTHRPQLDPEYGEQHEIAARPRPTPAQCRDEIIDEKTSIPRLMQIKDELYADKSMGATEVELIDGEKVRLVDLVLKVGRERKAARG